METDIEKIILSNLVLNEDYSRKVLPFIDKDYFSDYNHKVIYEEIYAFYEKYNVPPNKEALLIEVGDIRGITEESYKECSKFISSIEEYTDTRTAWLLEQTEKFCKDKALYNAIRKSIKIIDEDDKLMSKDSIPNLLSKALSISFDNNIGHDYLENVQERYDFYHRVEERIPFDIDILNKITKGGLPRKTMLVLLGGTGGGKSMVMSHIAANSLMQGFNVLYITLELSEERVAERIDCNLMNITLDDVSKLDYDQFNTKVSKISNKTKGKLVIKFYPTKTAHAGHFKALLDELSMKKNFKPDIIVVDYLGLCLSSIYKGSSGLNSYSHDKSVAEELRGIAGQYDAALITAVQANRGGMTNSDPEMENTADSIGVPFSADVYLALFSNEDMQKSNQLMFKILKNRFNDPNYYKKFMVGADRSRMKLYDLEDSSEYFDTGTSANYQFNDPPKNTFGNMSLNNKTKKDFSKFIL